MFAQKSTSVRSFEYPDYVTPHPYDVRKATLGGESLTISYYPNTGYGIKFRYMFRNINISVKFITSGNGKYVYTGTDSSGNKTVVATKRKLSDFLDNVGQTQSESFERDKEIEITIDEYFNNNEIDFENSNNAFSELKYYWELEDDKLHELLNALKEELKNNLYPCNIFPKIVVTLSALQNLDFQSNLIDEIITIMEDRIGKNLNKKYYINYDQIIRDEKVMNIYNNNVERLKLACKNKNAIINNDSLQDILNDADWGIKLYNYIYESENYNYFFNEKGFLSKLDIKKIINNIDKSNNKNIYHFKYCIDRMYGPGNLKEYYNGDRKAFEELIEGIYKLKEEKYGVTKKEAINYLERVISEKLELLEKNN